MNKRNGKAAEGHTAIKSLHIKLPANHPIFQYPDGERSKVAREWMDRGREILSSLEEIKMEVRKVGARMNNLHDREAPKLVENNSDEKQKINPALFLDL